MTRKLKKIGNNDVEPCAGRGIKVNNGPMNLMYRQSYCFGCPYECCSNPSEEEVKEEIKRFDSESARLKELVAKWEKD